jgi:hypothetical protein
MSNNLSFTQLQKTMSWHLEAHVHFLLLNSKSYLQGNLHMKMMSAHRAECG